MLYFGGVVLRASVQQETIRRVLAEMQEITAGFDFPSHSKRLEECSNILATLVKAPCLPDFNGPEVIWIGERMFVR